MSGAGAVLRCPDPACGVPVPAGDRFCEACGRLLPHGPAPARGHAREEGDRVEVWLPEAAGVCDRGLRRRRNEDAMALSALDGAGVIVLVVCDGVSSSAEAARASRTAADVTLAVLVAATAHEGADPKAAMREAAEEAQRAVAAVPYARASGKEPPASTLVAAVVRDRRATIGWLGDSRAYLVGPAGARLLSRDHTWGEELASRGPAPGWEAAGQPDHQALTRWLGADGEGGGSLPVRTVPIADAGHLLLCSDGLWNYAPSAERLGRLVGELAPGAAPLPVARRLADFARATGGHDNITVVVAALGGPGTASDRGKGEEGTS